MILDELDEKTECDYRRQCTTCKIDIRVHSTHKIPKILPILQSMQDALNCCHNDRKARDPVLHAIKGHKYEGSLKLVYRDSDDWPSITGSGIVDGEPWFFETCDSWSWHFNGCEFCVGKKTRWLGMSKNGTNESWEESWDEPHPALQHRSPGEGFEAYGETCSENCHDDLALAEDIVRECIERYLDHMGK